MRWVAADVGEQFDGEVAQLGVAVLKEAGTGTVRARLLDATAQPHTTTWATAEGADAICAAVRAWLEQRP